MELNKTDLHFSAGIFDLDGVVTHTAGLHSRAWKAAFDEYLETWSQAEGIEFVPFDIQSDYLRYVDGKPRYQGVQSFLESRDIHIPFGTPADATTANTCCGLGNRKNEFYNSLIDTEGVNVFNSTVSLIRELRARGIRVGLMSSSKNTEQILHRTGLTELFEARVDGVVSEQIGLRGKPHPDAFLKTAELLGVSAEDAFIVEDAVSGVEAGRQGSFGLVIGVDREGHPEALRDAGADFVVQDLAELTLDDIDELYLQHRRRLPWAIEHWGHISPQLEHRRIVVFLDYDGTLTPIVARPELATMSPSMRTIVSDLAQVHPVIVVSGRGREDVSGLVGLDNLYYAGSHGFDIAGPAGTTVRHEIGLEYRPALEQAARSFEHQLSGIDGVLIEDKKFSIAVHHRQAEEDEASRIEGVVDEVVRQEPQLTKTHGKKVFEVRPRLEWDKGKAVVWLLQALNLDSPDVMPLYIGDDVTDEDAFAVLKDRGLGILVTNEPRDTQASMYLRDTEEVGKFLRLLVKLRT